MVESTQGGSSPYELLKPRFTIFISPPEEIRQQLKSGQPAWLTTTGDRISLGPRLLDAAHGWIEGKLGSPGA